MKKFLGLHQFSFWMIAISIVLMALEARPSLLSYMIVLVNGAFMFVTREVSRGEGQVVHMSPVRIGAALAVIVLVVLFALRINWIAI